MADPSLTNLHLYNTYTSATAAPSAPRVSNAAAARLVSNAGVGVSGLKKSPFKAWVINNIFLSDLFRNMIGWAHAKTAEEYGPIVGRFTNRAAIAATVRNRGLPGLATSDEELGRELHTVIYSQLSPVAEAAALARSGSTENPDLVRKYNDPTAWGVPSTAKTPTLVGLRTLLTLTDVFIANGVRTAKEAGKTRVEDVLEAIAAAKTTAANTTTAQGEKAADAADAAAAQVSAAGASIFTSGYADVSPHFPAGTHLAYQFSNGALHHAIYLGSKIVVEVMNMETTDRDKIVKCFITVSHLDDFVSRAQGNGSEVFVYVYEDPYPLEVIKQRALWSIGRFPNYNIVSENCESFANWVFNNDFEATMCIVLKDSHIATAAERSAIVGGLTAEVEPVGEAIAAAFKALASPGWGGARRHCTRAKKRGRSHKKSKYV